MAKNSHALWERVQTLHMPYRESLVVAALMDSDAARAKAATAERISRRLYCVESEDAGPWQGLSRFGTMEFYSLAQADAFCAAVTARGAVILRRWEEEAHS